MTPVMVDLCAGLKGASAAMRDRGWRVVSVDIDPAFQPDVCANIIDWLPPDDLRRCDLVWGSPPCDEFARESMPWSRTGHTPSTALAEAAYRLMLGLQPRFFVLENVRGAVRHFEPLFGRFTHHFGPFFLWSNLPPLDVPVRSFKERLAGRQKAERARVPYALSLAVALAVEAQRALWESAA